MLRAIGVAVTDELRISLEGVDRVPAHVKVVLAVTVTLLGFVFVALRDSYSDDEAGRRSAETTAGRVV